MALASDAKDRSPKFEAIRHMEPLRPVTNPPVEMAASYTNKWLTDSELVLGITMDGQARAYPLNMISGPHREIINDTLGGAPIAVSWCSLCNNGMVFSRLVKGRTLTFGTEGSLWRSSMVMYDDETKSVWSQYLGEAMTGELTGTRLTQLPCAILDWKTWRTQYTNTSVLDLSRAVPL